MTQEPVILMTVFTTHRCCSIAGASAELNDGQNIHRKIVPIIENKSDVLLEELSTCSFASLVVSTHDAPKPKYAPKVCSTTEPPMSLIMRDCELRDSLKEKKRISKKVTTISCWKETLPNSPP